MFGRLPSTPRHNGPAPRAFGSPLPASLRRSMRLVLSASLVAGLATTTAIADVTIRVAAQPVTNPIHVYVKVDSEEELGPENFSVRVLSPNSDELADLGNPSQGNFSLPPALHEKQKVSVMFTMDYSNSTREQQSFMQDGASEFIKAMTKGDYAGVIKFNYEDKTDITAEIPNIQVLTDPPFIPIDDENPLLTGPISMTFDGSGSPIVGAIAKAVKQFQNHKEDGRKAIILVSDGGDNQLQAPGDASQVVRDANELEVSIFSIGVGNTSQLAPNRGNVTGEKLLTEFALQTYGSYFDAKDNEKIVEKYLEVADLLQNEYQLIFPYAVEECKTYDIEVSVEEFNFSDTVRVSSRCTSSTGGSSSGGGGAFGPLGLIAGLSLLALRRRLTMA